MINFVPPCIACGFPAQSSCMSLSTRPLARRLLLCIDRLQGTFMRCSASVHAPLPLETAAAMRTCAPMKASAGRHVTDVAVALAAVSCIPVWPFSNRSFKGFFLKRVHPTLRPAVGQVLIPDLQVGSRVLYRICTPRSLHVSCAEALIIKSSGRRTPTADERGHQQPRTSPVSWVITKPSSAPSSYFSAARDIEQGFLVGAWIISTSLSEPS